MKLTILGCHSATPRVGLHPTSQIIEAGGHVFLIDCGEGTQVQLRRYRIKFAQIKHIFISHLHGDHFFGLIGLISTFQLLGRTADLHIHAPKGLKDIITLQLKLSNSWSSYPLIFHELTTKEPQLIFEDDKLSIETIPLTHRVYANGFLFKEKEGLRKLLVEKAKEANINVAYFNKLKQGKDVENEDGVMIDHTKVTSPPNPPNSYAFCSDTKFKPDNAEQLQGVSMLYHEATFLEAHKHLCKKTGHSTAKEAAEIAKLSNAKQLILGHFSTRYNDFNEFVSEAKTIFQHTLLAEEGKSFEF